MCRTICSTSFWTLRTSRVTTLSVVEDRRLLCGSMSHDVVRLISCIIIKLIHLQRQVHFTHSSSCLVIYNSGNVEITNAFKLFSLQTRLWNDSVFLCLLCVVLLNHKIYANSNSRVEPSWLLLFCSVNDSRFTGIDEAILRNFFTQLSARSFEISKYWLKVLI